MCTENEFYFIFALNAVKIDRLKEWLFEGSSSGETNDVAAFSLRCKYR